MLSTGQPHREAIKSREKIIFGHEKHSENNFALLSCEELHNKLGINDPQ